jgi:hypothetical protein
LLRHLTKVAKDADPFKKYLTAKPSAKDAAKQSYVAQLAMLSDVRNFVKPQHAAIATLAMANNPEVRVSSKAIAAAYARIPHDSRGGGLMKTTITDH